MKQQTAETLSHAGLIDRLRIVQAPNGNWSIHLHGQGDEPLTPGENHIETARGGPRLWASLDTAHRWVTALPKRPRVVEIVLPQG